ncbi:ABC transporter ATP-binding protein [Pseudoxanthomonas sp.]|uniref:ABC transporter ATP-binding protein n=1 Tax=Pseudoxanthomonas sp. TaxID=1871049 RepID=UPI002635A1AD|nr:ABC transporter ATP-binding protein [Pseudoxanthomonas sp.]WDS37939.1 MAG: ABC transporter ATP-binding protein [Pseudoxanthomonas sp.]
MDPQHAAAPASLHGIHKRYGALTALDGVDLALQPGRVLALLGPNGAGKSTVVSLLLGLQRADAGQALLFGQSPQDIGVRRRVGVMLQSAALPDTLHVGELLAQTRGYYAEALSVADCVAIAGLDGLLRRRYGALSGGQQRRVQFALAICGRPQVLFLDEPTTGMDIQARRQLWAAIGERAAAGCAVLLTTHYLEEAEALADDVAVLQAGRIVARGSVSQIRASVLQRCIRAQTDLDADAIACWPGVHSARRDGAAIEIQAEPAEPIVARLLQADPHLHDLEVRRAGLADAFLAITDQQEAA